jgi:hypothetical protein
MSRPVIRSVALILFVPLLVALPSFAAAKKKALDKPDQAVGTVDSVLRSEVAGQVDRRERLASTLEQNPDSVSARWQAGFVRAGNQWRSFDEISQSTAESNVFKEYRARRQETALTSSGQLELADWCKKRGLADQERSHLSASLAFSPGREDLAVLQRLGFQRVGTQWLSPEQLQDWQRLNRRTEASLKKWSTKLERIAQRLSGSKGQHAAALTDLRGINDVSAVPAIELILTGRDQETALVAVDALHRMEGFEATLALAKQAVFSQWPEVRKGAAAVLKGRRLEDFVPQLITLLAIPGAGQFRFYHDVSRGILAYSYIVAVETNDQFRVSTLGILIQVVEVQMGLSPGGLAGGGSVPSQDQAARGGARSPNRLFSDSASIGTNNQAALGRADSDAVRLLADRLYGRERELEATNERMRELNERVIAVLADVSGKEPNSDARQWWQWWSDQTDSQTGQEKPVVVDPYEFEYAEIEAPVPPPISTTTFSPRAECLAAGTPVRTDRGMTPIEKIRIGDRVLAQDIETAELAYKPVLQTTIRPPRELCAFRVGDETIVCTAGHRFWTSGRGWVKARDLEAESLLHTVTGNEPVGTAKKGAPAQTYNLVVADFHNYFVGTTGLLSHDVLLPKSTDNLVPGLSRENAIGQKKK